jgi:hypothetical protein
MNVLLITYSFPPAAGVGVLRALSLAKYLPESDIRLDVLTARNAAAVGQDHGLLTQVPAGVTVHRTWTPDLPFALRKGIKKLLSRGAPSGSSAPTQAGSTLGRPNPIKQWVANLLLPDPQLGWVPFAVRAARRIIRERQIDVVLLTVPPFSSVRTVTRLRRLFPALRIVLDFRDEWLTSTIHLVSFNNNQRAKDVAFKAESEAVRAASAVVCVTEAAAAKLRKRYPAEPADKFVCIPNGYDKQPPTDLSARSVPVQSSSDLTTFTYIGTVYGSTDPETVVDALLSLPPEVQSRLRLRFIGHIETPALRETLRRLTQSPVTLELIGFLPQAQALAHIAETDYLLLITHDPINVAAKLYDYLGSGRPIVAAVHPTGDVRRILDRTRAGWSASIQEPADIAQLFTDAVARRPNLAQQFQPDYEAIAAYHRKPLAARYAKFLHSIAATRTPVAERP